MSLLANLSDDELLELLRNDDEKAFSEIYQRYVTELADFCGSRLHQVEDAHDVLQDLFVKLWEGRHLLDVRGNLKSYLFTALRYRIIDKIRRNVRREQYAEMIIPLLEIFQADDPYERLKAKDTKAFFDLQLQKLSERTQQIYRLSREKHFSIKEIAHLLGLSEQTVKNQLTIALKHLRDIAPLLVLIDWLKN